MGSSSAVTFLSVRLITKGPRTFELQNNQIFFSMHLPKTNLASLIPLNLAMKTGCPDCSGFSKKISDPRRITNNGKSLEQKISSHSPKPVPSLQMNWSILGVLVSGILPHPPASSARYMSNSGSMIDFDFIVKSCNISLTASIVLPTTKPAGSRLRFVVFVKRFEAGFHPYYFCLP